MIPRDKQVRVQAVVTGLFGLIPLAGLLWYHDAAFGSPTAFPYDYSVWKEPSTGVFMGIDAMRLLVRNGEEMAAFRLPLAEPRPYTSVRLSPDAQRIPEPTVAWMRGPLRAWWHDTLSSQAARDCFTNSQCGWAPATQAGRVRSQSLLQGRRHSEGLRRACTDSMRSTLASSSGSRMPTVSM